MIEIIDVPTTTSLDDYASYVQLAPAVRSLQADARELTQELEGRTVWMINSTAEGGGVAEMMPKLVGLLREMGVRTEWAVISPDAPRFFALTKKIHNLLHGSGTPDLDADDQALFETVSQQLAGALDAYVEDGDLLVVHDPQPLGLGALLRGRRDIHAVWRCHIGLNRSTPATRAAWAFLRPWTKPYDQTVFSVRDYVPSFLDDRSAIIPPAIDPLSHKNRDLSAHKLSGVLCNAGLASDDHPVLTPPFDAPALRLQPGGTFAPATEPDDLGLLFRPIVTQVSRWDRLKGFAPLLRGFARLKMEHNRNPDGRSKRHRRRLDLVRLVLAGPDPASVQDDPEGLETFEEIRDLWEELPPAVQQDVAVLTLPMTSRKYNALMVNALQRCSTVVVQNSLREGFGLTATEAMWKQCPVLGTHAVGLRTQIRPGVDGCLLDDPEDPEEIATTLDAMLDDAKQREVWGRNGQTRVAARYLVFAQAHRWLKVLNELG